MIALLLPPPASGRERTPAARAFCGGVGLRPRGSGTSLAGSISPSVASVRDEAPRPNESFANCWVPSPITIGVSFSSSMIVSGASERSSTSALCAASISLSWAR